MQELPHRESCSEILFRIFVRIIRMTFLTEILRQIMVLPYLSNPLDKEIILKKRGWVGVRDKPKTFRIDCPSRKTFELKIRIKKYIESVYI